MVVKIKIYTLLLLNCLFTGYSQTNADKELAKNILDGVQARFDNAKKYDYLISFKMYQGEKGNRVEKEYSGRVARENRSTYYQAADSETILSKGYYIRASHGQKVVEFNNKTSTIEKTPLEVSQYLNYFKTAKVTDKGSYWICTLSVGKFTALDYNKITLYINKDYTLTRQVILFLKKIPFKNNKGIEEFDYPRLEITLSTNKDRAPENIFDLSRYIAVKGSKVSPSVKLKEYKIIDLNKN